MTKAAKAIAWITGIGVAIYTLNSLRNLAQVGSELVIESVPSFKINWLKGITITTQLVFKNPTQQALRITHPFTRILASENATEPLASSAANPELLNIPAFGQIQSPQDFSPIVIDISWTNLALYAKDLFNAIKNKQSATLFVESSVRILTKAGTYISKKDVKALPIT